MQQQQHNVYMNTAPHHEVHLHQGYTGRVVTTGATQPAGMAVCMLMFGFFLIIPGGVMTSIGWSSAMSGIGITCLTFSMILLTVGFATCCRLRSQQQMMARPATATVTTTAVNVMQNHGNVPQHNFNTGDVQQSFAPTQTSLSTNIHATTTILQNQTQPGFQQFQPNPVFSTGPTQQGYQPYPNQESFPSKTDISPPYPGLPGDAPGFQTPLSPPSYQDATADNR